jgi:lipoprotein-releasing system permease protein
MNGWDNSQVGGFEITIKDFRKLDTMTEEVNGLLGFDLRAFSVKEIHRTIFSWLGAQDINAKFIVILMLGVCCINMVSALLILILERTQMIGILKALGSSDWSIRKIFIINAGYLVGLGMLGGNLLGLGIAYGQNRFGWFKLDPASYFLSAVPMNLNPVHVLILNIATLVICVLVLIIPTYLVTRISPVKAIRFT